MKRRLVMIMIVVCLLVACSHNTVDGKSVAPGKIRELVCGVDAQADCIPDICTDPTRCPLAIALSNPAVFDFVANYSACEGCNTPDFVHASGIGKCIEYRLQDESKDWTVGFWVSEICSFRYGSPGQSRITVQVNSETLKIDNITPSAAYLKDKTYCQTEGDCACLAGSGVEFVGCANRLYAPLNWSGYYACSQCECVANRCVRTP